MRTELDRIAEMNFAVKKAKEEGNMEIAKNMLAGGEPIAKIVAYTGLAEEVVLALQEAE